MEPPGSHKAAKGAKGSASQAKGTGAKWPAANGHTPAALSVAGLAALTDTPAILKAVQKAQAAAGQTFKVGKAAAGEAAAGKSSTAQKAAGGQAAFGKAAVSQTTAAGQAALKAMQPGIGGASSRPPAAVQQAPGAAVSGVTQMRPTAKDHEEWSNNTLEAARRSKITSEEELSKAIKAATAAKKAAIVAAKRKYAEVGCIAMLCRRALQPDLLEYAEAHSRVCSAMCWPCQTSLGGDHHLASQYLLSISQLSKLASSNLKTLHSAQAAPWLNCVY